MGHRDRGRFLQDGWLGPEPVHVFEHMMDDDQVVVMPTRRDVGDWAVPRHRVTFLPDQPRGAQ